MYSDRTICDGMTQKKLDPYMPYDKTDEESILRRAAKLTGNTLNQLIEYGEEVIGGTSTKGIFGQVVEEGYFLIENNNSPLPDFQDAGIELKVTPMKRNGKGLVSKERLILGIINYDEVPERHFNIFLDKDSHILIVFYLWEENKDIYDYEFLKVVDWSPTPEELRMIKEDWDVIEGYIMRGEAHLLSERHTKYLAACTKGAGHGKDMRSQPFSEELAKQRALSFKASFMTELFNSHPDVGELILDSVPEYDLSSILHGDWSIGETFEEHVVHIFDRFVGMSCIDIERSLGIELKDTSKQYYYMLTLAMMGVTKKHRVKEFDEAGIAIKTIRLKTNGRPKESMSFPAFKYEEIVEQTWETSDFYSQIDCEFFFPVFQFNSDDPTKEGRKELRFKGAFFWYVPDDDFVIIEKVWEDTKQKVLEERFDDFVKSSDGRISHVRPHGRDSNDTYPYKGKDIVKKSFWFNDTYIRDVVRKHLKDD